jgi:prolipoprotein diacylglyceryl transferase
MLLPASIPSPEDGSWLIGPVPVRGYALMILLGMIVGLIVANRRWQQRGGRPGTAYDVALWAIPFGIIGARLYHVVTDWQLYFAADGSGIVGAVQIWNGGLGIWGAVAGGALGAWIACRRRGIPLTHFADAVAPSLILAQAIGRWGNYLNQELFGRPSDLPWAVEIDPGNRPPGYEEFETFHATFLYESLWNLGVFFVLLWADRRWRIGHGRLFALYVALYCAGRVWIEALRIDTVNTILGLRLNIWTSIIVGLAAVVYMIISARRHPGRLDYTEPDPEAPVAAVGDDSREAERAAATDPAAPAEPDPGTPSRGPDA